MLSQNFIEQFLHLLPAHPAPFDHSGYYPDVLDQGLAPPPLESGSAACFTGLDGIGCFFRYASFCSAWELHPATPAIEPTLFRFPFLLLVIGDTAPGRLLPAVGFPAAKGAAQILAASVARIGKEKNPAMPAAAQAATPLRPLSEN